MLFSLVLREGPFPLPVHGVPSWPRPRQHHLVVVSWVIDILTGVRW